MKFILKIDFFVIAFLLFGFVILNPILPQTYSLNVNLEELPKADEMILQSEKDIPQHIWIAGQYLKAGKFRDVITICKQVLNMKQNNIDAHAQMAAAHKGLGEEDKFIKESKYIKEQIPESPVLYIYLAQAYMALKDFKNVENSYKEGLKTASKKTVLYLGLADFYLTNGRLDEASEEYNKLLMMKNLDVEYFLNANFALCRIELQEKKYNQVIKRAGMLIDMYPTLPQGYLFLGNAYIAEEKIDNAIKIYEKLIKVNPKTPIPYQELALIYIDKIVDYNKALVYAEKCVREFPEDAKSHDILGWFYYKNGKYQEALEQFQSAVRLSEKNSNYHYHLGLTYQMMKDKLKAIKAFERTFDLLDPNESKKFISELKKRIDECK